MNLFKIVEKGWKIGWKPIKGGVYNFITDKNYLSPEYLFIVEKHLKGQSACSDSTFSIDKNYFLSIKIIINWQASYPKLILAGSQEANQGARKRR